MTSLQTLVFTIGMVLVALSMHEFWQAELRTVL